MTEESKPQFPSGDLLNDVLMIRRVVETAVEALGAEIGAADLSPVGTVTYRSKGGAAVSFNYRGRTYHVMVFTSDES